jgi:phage-related tail fiber protein
MTMRYLHHVSVELPLETETMAEARVRLTDKFPRGALRRMTHLGMLVGSALEKVTLTRDAAVIYATTFAETRALEDFLGSFPSASPLLFQTSIHPGGIQQVLVGRQQPIARLWPLAAQRHLVTQALTTAWLETAPQVVIVGGEERGTWMFEAGMAAPRPFAFALVLTREAAGAIGRMEFSQASEQAVEECSLEEFARALAQREPLTVAGASGTWKIEWL